MYERNYLIVQKDLIHTTLYQSLTNGMIASVEKTFSKTFFVVREKVCYRLHSYGRFLETGKNTMEGPYSYLFLVAAFSSKNTLHVKTENYSCRYTNILYTYQITVFAQILACKKKTWRKLVKHFSVTNT